jgi:hypothetical protein
MSHENAFLGLFKRDWERGGGNRGEKNQFFSNSHFQMKRFRRPLKFFFFVVADFYQ